MARSMPFYPLKYAPDFDPSWQNNPGVIVGMANYVPTKRRTYANFANGPTQDMSGPTSIPIATYGTPCTGYVFKAVSGAAASARMFVLTKGSKRRIVELTSAGGLTDRSKGATDYSATLSQWTMTSAGNAMLAANGVDIIQVSTGGIFSDLATAPVGAQCLCSNLGFVLAGYNGDGTNPDSVGWSALEDYTSWTPSLATQAGNYRLLDTPGPVRALVPLRDSVIAYKDDSIYLGDYIADTVNGVIWGWRLISDKIGCASPHGVVVQNNVHYFLHSTGVYAFDGAQVSNIGSGVQATMLRLTGDYSALTAAQASVDELEGLIYLGYPDRTSSASNTELSHVLMLNVNTGEWGGCMGSASDTIPWHEATYTNGHLYAFMHARTGDLMQWKATVTWAFSLGSAPVCIGSGDNGANAKLRIPQYNKAIVTQVVGAAGQSALLTGLVANDKSVRYLRRIWPRFIYFGTQGVTPAAQVYHDRQEGVTAAPPSLLASTASPDPTWNSTEYAFDSSGPGYSDRCLQFVTNLNGPNEISGFWLDFEDAGQK